MSLIDSIRFPTSDASRDVGDALKLQQVIERHGYQGVIAAIRALRKFNGDDFQKNAVSSRFSRVAARIAAN